MAATATPLSGPATVPLLDDIEGGGNASDDEMDLKNDFAYHNNVAGAAKQIRMGFLRKVYGLLSVQLALTTLIAAVCLFTPQIKVGNPMMNKNKPWEFGTRTTSQPPFVLRN